MGNGMFRLEGCIQTHALQIVIDGTGIFVSLAGVVVDKPNGYQLFFPVVKPIMNIAPTVSSGTGTQPVVTVLDDSVRSLLIAVCAFYDTK